MNTLYEVLWRYSLAIVSGVEHYCKWAEGTAKSENDLRWLILGPVGLFGSCSS